MDTHLLSSFIRPDIQPAKSSGAGLDVAGVADRRNLAILTKIALICVRPGDIVDLLNGKPVFKPTFNDLHPVKISAIWTFLLLYRN